MPALRRAPVRESFLRQVYFTGVTASTGVVLRASGLGALIIAFTMQVLDADTVAGGQDPAAGWCCARSARSPRRWW